MLQQLLFYLFALGFVALLIVGSFEIGTRYRDKFGVEIWINFLRRTGYRRKADPNAPLADQASVVLAELFRPEGVGRGPFIRDVEGLTITYSSLTSAQGDASATEETWQLDLPFDARMQVQVLERRVAAPEMLAKLSSQTLGRERRWGALLPHKLSTGDRSFDKRFLVLSDRPDPLPAFLRDPAVRQALSTLPEVCLVVAQRWINLDDASGALRRKYLGLAITPRQLMEREPPLHDHVAHTLVTIARSLRAHLAP